MTSTNLQTIDISQLKAGMYVHGIVRQGAETKVKSRGKVKNNGIIKRLKEIGVLQLQIDLNKAFDPETDENLQPKTHDVTETELVSFLKNNAPKKAAHFNDELNRAAKLHKEGKSIQYSMLTKVAKGFHFDIDIPKEFTKSLIQSIDRNPNALMCLSKIRKKGSYLLDHSLNVAVLLAHFSTFLGLSKEDVEELSLTGFLHDIGKVKVPNKILNKPGKLTDQEMVVMRNHVLLGARDLNKMDIPKRIVRTVAEHHERLNGQGYPKGIKGDKISKFSRMLAIVDSYDAITADRCYKQGMSSQKALRILLENSPAEYDRELVQQFIKCVGVYPVGSLVKLTNQQVAMVISQNKTKPLMPVVKVFYSLPSKAFVPSKDVNLSSKGLNISIEGAISAREMGIDFNRFFEEKIAV